MLIFPFSAFNLTLNPSPPSTRGRGTFSPFSSGEGVGDEVLTQQKSSNFEHDKVGLIVNCYQ